ncbi:MAG TPA: gamma-glutamyl-gamma-aminobutyrate hydrolase family protein [Bacillota bacterium]|nr:gamma-glutamyl-gamma-aminobutyrate hydrolase family protein [Bacillota bacterium]
MKPLIGIACSCETNGGRLFLNGSYPSAVAAAGGVPVLLPVLKGFEADYLALVDGIVLPGGGDLDPFLFGEEPSPLAGEINPGRDSFEIGVARLALERGVPVLGICRGIQVINVAAGGTVCQDISLMTGSPLKHFQAAPRWYPTHGLEIVPGSMLAGMLGGAAIRVNSFHHQAVARVAGGFRVSARSPEGVIEGIEAESGYAVGVQFHPEDMCGLDERFLNIFKSLVDAAAVIAGGKSAAGGASSRPDRQARRQEGF